MRKEDGNKKLHEFAELRSLIFNHVAVMKKLRK